MVDENTIFYRSSKFLFILIGCVYSFKNKEFRNISYLYLIFIATVCITKAPFYFSIPFNIIMMAFSAVYISKASLFKRTLYFLVLISLFANIVSYVFFDNPIVSVDKKNPLKYVDFYLLDDEFPANMVYFNPNEISNKIYTSYKKLSKLNPNIHHVIWGEGITVPSSINYSKNKNLFPEVISPSQSYFLWSRKYNFNSDVRYLYIGSLNPFTSVPYLHRLNMHNFFRHIKKIGKLDMNIIGEKDNQYNIWELYGWKGNYTYKNAWPLFMNMSQFN